MKGSYLPFPLTNMRDINGWVESFPLTNMRDINGWVESFPLTNMRDINGWVESFKPCRCGRAFNFGR